MRETHNFYTLPYIPHSSTSHKLRGLRTRTPHAAAEISFGYAAQHTGNRASISLKLIEDKVRGSYRGDRTVVGHEGTGHYIAPHKGMASKG